MAQDGQIIINTAINTNDVNAGIQDIESRVEKLADRMGSVGETMSKAITVPLTAVGAAGIAAAASVGESQTKIQNSLGLTKEEAEALTGTAKNIYKAGFGESLDDVTNALLSTKQNIKGLSDEKLEGITKSAVNLANTFDADVNEVTRAGQNLIKGFGVDADTAFDLMAHGAQNGLNFSQEMFDNLSEYAPLFGKMGFSAEEYFQLLEQGSKAGVYNLDYVNDVMKEFQIRVKDGSKATTDAMGQMSKGTQKVWKDFLAGKGTVKDVHNTVIEELKGMKDQVKANEIGVGLYGTKWEDLEADAMYALGNIDGGVKGVKGSMDEMNKVSEESFGQKWKAFSREALMALEPLGKVLLDFAMAVLPKVSAAIQKVSEWFANLSPAGQQIAVIVGMIVAAIGPFLTIVGMMIGPITNVIGLLSRLRPVFTAIRTAMLALTGPVGIITAIVVALGILIYKNWDEISAWTIEKWEQIKTFLVNFWEATKIVFHAAVEYAKAMISAGWEWIKTTTQTVWEGIKNFFSNTWTWIKTTFNNAVTAVKNYVSEKWQAIKTKTNEIFDAVRTKIQGVWEAIRSFVRDKVDTIKQVVQDRFEQLKEVIRESMEKVRSTVEDLWGKVQGFFEDINLFDVGRDIIQGLIDGLWGKLDSLMKTAGSIASKIEEKIRGALDTHSPSRVTMEIGSDTTEGLEVGMKDRIKSLAKTASSVALAASEGMRHSLKSPVISSSVYTEGQGSGDIINLDRLFENANISIRRDSDIKQLAYEVVDLIKPARKKVARL